MFTGILPIFDSPQVGSLKSQLPSVRHVRRDAPDKLYPEPHEKFAFVILPSENSSTEPSFGLDNESQTPVYTI